MVNCHVDDTGPAIELSLTGDAVMASAVALQEQLLAAVVPGRDIVVNVGGLERLDGAGLQLLLALKRMVEHGGGAMTLRAVTDGCRTAIETAAADALLVSK